VLVGPTASGKSSVALALAERRIAAGDPVEIVTVDSMQVYRGMDVGTAKPTAEEQGRVPHHLLDMVDPTEEYSVARFARSARSALDGIDERGARAVLVGGTALYVQAVVDELALPGRFPEVARDVESEPDTAALHERLRSLDPAAASRIEPGNRRRIVRALEVTIGSGRRFSEFGPGLREFGATPFVLAGLRVPREVVGERIAQRYRQQLADGFLDEVARLDRAAAGAWSRTAAQALGYRELLAHLHGECTLDEAIEAAVVRTRQFAVRQIRWFRRDPRITWFDHDGDPSIIVDALDELWRCRSDAAAGS
jgi:tRNA dimethylallyltransferase